MALVAAGKRRTGKEGMPLFPIISFLKAKK